MRYSNLVKACEDAWKVIQQTQLDVPNAVVVVGSGGRSAPTLLGHFAKDTWEDEDGEAIHEVLIVAEQLRREPKEIFQTLLHEAVHGIAHTRKIKDVSGKRHNKKFAALCDEVGMDPPVRPDPRIGYSAATLRSETETLYAPQIDAIAEALSVCRKLKITEKETKKTTWVARCGCERKIRVPKKSIEDPETLNIACQSCGTEFYLKDEELDAWNDQFTNA